MRKVFLEELPRKTKRYFDWDKIINDNIFIKFVYDDISGNFNVINKNDKYITIVYDNKNPLTIDIPAFYACKFAKYIGIDVSSDYRYEIGENIISDEINITITSKRKIHRKTYIEKRYGYKCNICGYNNGDISENYVGENKCSCCSGKIAVLGINTIWDTDRWMVDLGVSEEYAKKYTKCSSKKARVICPSCGREDYKCIANIYIYKSICCSKCSDGLPYPEKFMFNMLEQLNVNFETQFSPEWIGLKRYDFYFVIDNKQYIVEMDGALGHGKKTHSKSNKTIEETQADDDYKDEQARLHNIEVIRIDADKSELEYIKSEILNSKLNAIFNLSNINWSKCEEFALKSRVKEACEIKKDNPEMSTTEIGKTMNIAGQTVAKYLKQGSKIWNWINYDPILESRKIVEKNAENNKKTVLMYKDNVFMGEFESSAYIQSISLELFGEFIYSCEINRVCNGVKKHYKGFKFEYKDDVVKCGYKIKEKEGKKVRVIKDGVEIGIYKSCNFLERNSLDLLGVSLQKSKISLVCNGIRKMHKGFVFEYVDN